MASILRWLLSSAGAPVVPTSNGGAAMWTDQHHSLQKARTFAAPKKRHAVCTVAGI